MAARGEAVIEEGKSLRRAPTHSSLLPSFALSTKSDSRYFSKLYYLFISTA